MLIFNMSFLPTKLLEVNFCLESPYRLIIKSGSENADQEHGVVYWIERVLNKIVHLLPRASNMHGSVFR